MTDEKYTYITDVSEKARTARGARAKRSGSKTHYCGLPSDKLSAAELKRRSGKVKTYNLKAPMKWEEFKPMPDDLKREYLTKLVSSFGVGQASVAEMMGVKPNTLTVNARKMNPPYHYPRSKPRFNKTAWELWLAGNPIAADTPVEIVPVQKPEIAETHKPESPAARNTQVLPDFGTVSFSGDAKSVLATLSDFLGEGEYECINVAFKRKEVA